MLRSKVRNIIGFSLLCALLCAQVFAQYTTADLGGTVSDSTGSAVPGAKVTVRNTETGFSQDSTTSASGAFLFPRLRVGAYELRVEKEGFFTYVQSGITLVVDQAANVSVALQVGQVSNQVTLTGETELVTSRTTRPAAGAINVSSGWHSRFRPQ